MAVNSQQFSHLVGRLLQKTQERQVRWSQTAEAGKYQIRFGDYAITISSIGMAHAAQPEVLFQIQKLSGDPVASVSTQTSALASLMANSAPADPVTTGTLRQLYALVADRSDDLDDLIKLIG